MSLITLHRPRAHALPIDSLTWAWGIVASILMAAGYGWYIWLFFTGSVEPNATSWSLWAIGGGLEAWSFLKIINAGKQKKSEAALAFPSLVCAVAACIIAFLGIVVLRTFSLPSVWEWIAVVMDIGVVVAYVVIKALKGEESRAAKVANALMIADILISFVPILVSTWVHPGGEDFRPWFIWTMSYGIVAITGLIQVHQPWKERVWLVAYPLISAVVHGAVGVIALTLGGA